MLLPYAVRWVGEEMICSMRADGVSIFGLLVVKTERRF